MGLGLTNREHRAPLWAFIAVSVLAALLVGATAKVETERLLMAHGVPGAVLVPIAPELLFNPDYTFGDHSLSAQAAPKPVGASLALVAKVATAGSVAAPATQATASPATVTGPAVRHRVHVVRHVRAQHHVHVTPQHGASRPQGHHAPTPAPTPVTKAVAVAQHGHGKHLGAGKGHHGRGSLPPGQAKKLASARAVQVPKSLEHGHAAHPLTSGGHVARAHEAKVHGNSGHTQVSHGNAAHAHASHGPATAHGNSAHAHGNGHGHGHERHALRHGHRHH